MTPEETKHYLMLAAIVSNHDIDAAGVDVVSPRFMRCILKRLILRGVCINCALCGQQIQNKDDLSLDHIVPHSCGGSNYLHNMQPAHRECNKLKGKALTDSDIEVADESTDTILERKKKRKESSKKHRNVQHMKPWQIYESGFNR